MLPGLNQTGKPGPFYAFTFLANCRSFSLDELVYNKNQLHILKDLMSGHSPNQCWTTKIDFGRDVIDACQRLS